MELLRGWLSNSVLLETLPILKPTQFSFLGLLVGHTTLELWTSDHVVINLARHDWLSLSSSRG